MSHTCGNIDGKPCEWLGRNECPSTCFTCQVRNSEFHEACAPMLALVEAREKIRLLEAEVRAEEAVRETLTDEVERLSKIEKAAGDGHWVDSHLRAHQVSAYILRGLGPDGKEVE